MPEVDATTVDTNSQPEVNPQIAEREAADDAWLKANIGGTEKAEHDPGDEDDSRPEPKTPKRGDTAAQTDTDTDTDTASDGDTATDETDEDLAKALSALRRDGTPQRTIDSMLDAEDGLDELKAWGLKRAKVHADLDRKFSENKRSEPDPSESQTGKGESGDTAASTGAPKDNLADLVERFKDEYGDEAADTFRQFGERMREQNERQMREFQKDNQITKAYMERVMLREARDAVSKDFPQLKDDAAYRSVEAKVRSMVKTGDYQDAESAMRDAAYIVLGPEIIRKAKPALDQSRRLKNSGGPTVKSHKAPASSMTPAERDDAALDMILEGKSANDVRKALRH
jgi:hypothetical protein